jgi:hypothetical protein
MPAGLQIRNAAGVLVFDSTTAVGGVFLDFKTYPGASTEVLTFPDFAGATPSIIHTGRGGTDPNVTVDTTLGYPRVTVGTSNTDRTFAVMVR